jgi:dUTP pyrophosphatase
MPRHILSTLNTEQSLPENPKFTELYERFLEQHNESKNEPVWKDEPKWEVTENTNETDKCDYNRFEPDIELEGKFDRGTSFSAGYDIYSTENVEIPPKEMVMIATGIKIISCPDNIYFKIHSRSGLFLKRRLEAFSGVVDSDYTGEFKVLLTNHGNEVQAINIGDSIAQFTIERFRTVSQDRVRLQNHNHSGFGSTA